MNTSSLSLHILPFRSVRTYLYALMFVAGNVLLPQLCHLIPNGGLMLLPIYFFTLIGAYLYGWQVGLLTAIASPLVNHWMFGMPPAAVLPALLIKSSLLALVAAYVARRSAKVSILSLLLIVLSYQILGSIAETLLAGSFAVGFQDFRIGIPGMLLQIFAGYLLLRPLTNS